MKALQWLLVVVGVLGMLLCLAIAVGPVWLNTFIHTAAFRSEVQQRASQSIGGTVQIDSIDFSLWSGVKLHGLVTQIDPSRVNGQGALVARVESVGCNYSLINLLRRRLELTGVTLDKPQIILTRQPAAEVSPPAPADTTATGGAAPTTPTTPGGHAAPFQFVLDSAKINDGSLSIRDATGVSMAELHGIQIAARTAGYTEGKDVTGTVRISEVTLPSNMSITDFSTPFTYRTGAAEAKPFEAAAFGGRLAGDYVLGPEGPSLLDINAKGVDMTQLTHAVNFSPTIKLGGSLDLQSKWRGVETGRVDGEGDGQLTNAGLEGVPVLHQLAGLLRLNELNSPVIKLAQTHFQVGADATRFTGLQVDAGIFQMTGDGTIQTAGGLSADLVLILTRDAMNRIPKEIGMFFVKREDGSASVAFHLGGTIAHPDETDLPTRLLLQSVPLQNTIHKTLDRFFH